MIQTKCYLTLGENINENFMEGKNNVIHYIRYSILKNCLNEKSKLNSQPRLNFPLKPNSTLTTFLR